MWAKTWVEIRKDDCFAYWAAQGQNRIVTVSGPVRLHEFLIRPFAPSAILIHSHAFLGTICVAGHKLPGLTHSPVSERWYRRASDLWYHVAFVAENTDCIDSCDCERITGFFPTPHDPTVCGRDPVVLSDYVCVHPCLAGTFLMRMAPIRTRWRCDTGRARAPPMRQTDGRRSGQNHGSSKQALQIDQSQVEEPLHRLNATGPPTVRDAGSTVCSRVYRRSHPISR